MNDICQGYKNNFVHSLHLFLSVKLAVFFVTEKAPSMYKTRVKRNKILKKSTEQK